ncbi:hypothetical protein LEP1GSC043_4099 [Leptospira weilii str. Ecochallenge]|uniref:Uncharacterized protein n=1 Tax=Leptospira weilii str. Ecochallenge TaxID=1049986 RepID=N1UEY4_9LEPT|nr:hypothetical protein LEP1GSC051_1162 [Leptospira sp. P2653]EMY14590.1 hypothetical protein LEP1GSC043_4099 [Leptospira weilii str. Ecochallenge]
MFEKPNFVRFFFVSFNFLLRMEAFVNDSNETTCYKNLFRNGESVSHVFEE